MISAWWLMTAFLAGATVSGVWFWLQDYLDRIHLDPNYGAKTAEGPSALIDRQAPLDTQGAEVKA